jgi:riboflavin synthase
MLVAYTQEKIVIPAKKEGESVNVEVDMSGKYIEKQVKAYLEQGFGVGEGVLEKVVEGVVERKLKERGL